MVADFVEKNCPICCARYSIQRSRLKHGRGVTCSKECSYILRGKQKNKSVVLTCPVCNKEFSKVPSQMGHQTNYCSQDCAYKGRSLGFTVRKISKPYNTTPSTKKRVFVECENCGKKIETIPALENRKRFCSKTCRSESLQKTMLGNNNPSWIDGRSYQKRCHRGFDWEEKRQAAYQRDRFTCQKCFIKCVSRRDMNNNNSHALIQCHHIVFWSQSNDNSLDNLITLCASCHGKIHQNNLDVNEPI